MPTLYSARIQWALERPDIKTLRVSHREDNAASKHAILKHGFTIQNAQEIDWPDGTCAIEYMYELSLEALRSRPAS